ncbi:MAG TPA: potassium channel family protein [Streptosporangiaceae bacterium]|nr:potassium channel family protein [Streptosporangiaceae bacterium]
MLLVLVATYLLSAFNGTKLAVQLQIGLFVVVLLLALRTSPLPGPWPRLIAAFALAGSAGALAASLTGTQAGEGAAELWKGVMLLTTAVLVVRRVLARPTVDIQSIYGALSAYLITGLMFAAFYAAIDHLIHSPFFADNQPGTTQTFQYFSFVTLTTLGYGDFTAAGSGGRALAVIEALAGQVFLATLVARLVSAYRTPARQAGPASRRPPRSIRYGPRTVRRGTSQADARGPASRSAERPTRRPPRSGG